MDCEPASTAELADVEAALGVSLPEDLKALLRACAGGCPAKNFYEHGEEAIELGVGYVLPAKPDPNRGDVSRDGKQLRDMHSLPDTMVPFAVDLGHANHFCVDTQTGQVIYWLHAEPDDRARKVCASLDQFLAGLEECPF